MSTPHRSDSSVQQKAEKVIHSKLSALTGKDLQPATATFATGSAVQVDAVDASEAVYAESLRARAS